MKTVKTVNNTKHSIPTRLSQNMEHRARYPLFTVYTDNIRFDYYFIKSDPNGLLIKKAKTNTVQIEIRVTNIKHLNFNPSTL